MISGGSLVRKDVPPYIKVAKEPLVSLVLIQLDFQEKAFSKKNIRNTKYIQKHLSI